MLLEAFKDAVVFILRRAVDVVDLAYWHGYNDALREVKGFINDRIKGRS